MTSTTPLDRYCPDCGATTRTAEDARCFACGALLVDASQAVAPARGERLAPGDLLHGRYRIITQVGTGGYGAVYRAKDTQNGEKAVAVKAINVRDLAPQEAIDATDTFNREVALLSDLVHPSLPSVCDHFTDAAHWYLVMEFIEGETLEKYVRHTTQTGQLPLADVLEIGIHLCSILDYLHTRQPPIIFRDVKPANVMRTRTGHLYLIDFGIARRYKPGQPRDTIALGSPGYAAPEQYGRVQTTAQADIYSLGVTLHQLLTGHDPSETPCHLPPLDSLAPHLPPELVALIERMLNLDAGKRPESMAEVKAALQTIAHEQIRGLAPLPPASTGYVYYVPPGTGNATGQIAAQRRSRWKTTRFPRVAHLAPVAAAVLVVGGLIASLLLVFPQPVYPLRSGVSSRCFEGPRQTMQTSGQRGSPASLYIHQSDSVYRLDVQTRTVIWQQHGLGQASSIYPNAPVVIGDTVYIPAGSTLSALNTHTGAFRWSCPFPGDVTSPSMEGGLLYVSPGSASLDAVNPATGTISAGYTPKQRDWRGYYPIVVDGVLYYTAGSELSAVQLPGEKPLWQQRVGTDTQEQEGISVQNGIVYVQVMQLAQGTQSQVGLIDAFDAQTGRKLWQSPALPRAVRTVTITGGMIYAAAVDELAAFDVYTHALVWRQPFNTFERVVASGTLYITCDTGNGPNEGFAALNARTGKLLWQTSNRAGGGVELAGVLDGVLYGAGFSNDGKVTTIYALNASTGTQLWTMSEGPFMQWGGMVAVDTKAPNSSSIYR